MAIYHLSIKIHGRSKGQSAIGCAAYRAGEKLKDGETGRIYDYTRKKEVVHKEIMLCANAPPEFQDRSTLWNSVMKVEKASNAQFAREFELALPVELSREDQIEVLREFFQPMVDDGMCIDFAIHDKRDGNPHCHALATMRPINSDGTWGLKEKKGFLLDDDGNRIPIIDPKTGQQKVDKRGRKQWKRGLTDSTGWNSRSMAERWRASWAQCCNKRLDEHHRIDHRSYVRQKKAQLPTIHEGYGARIKDQNFEQSERVEHNRQVRFFNQFFSEIADRIEELKDTFRKLMTRIEQAKEVIHGKRYIPGSQLTGRSLTRHDVSDRGPAANDAGRSRAAGGSGGRDQPDPEAVRTILKRPDPQPEEPGIVTPDDEPAEDELEEILRKRQQSLAEIALQLEQLRAELGIPKKEDHKPEPMSKAETEPVPAPEPKPEPQQEPTAQPQPQLKPEPRPQPHPEQKPQSEPQPKPEPEPVVRRRRGR